MKSLPLVLSLAVVALAGCDKQSAPPTAAAAPGSNLPTEAQPRLQTIKLWLGAEEMVTELALTPRQQQTGMMFRTNMAENEGMLFPMPVTQRVGFWMMNCPLSLSAAYIDPSGVIQEIHKLEANNTNTVLAASDNIRFVLETPLGWFERHHITVGTSVRTERGPLMDTFFKH